ncbi:hypothetical protein ISS85_02565 [Candidatus Microgenomates bacterium]|nr:hypothetical protein [Candidatus Microgenomates bacterium]
MLENLIISRVRVKVLTLFLLNPGKIFYVREIVRKVSEEINAVRRELAHLEKAKMVKKEKRANRLYYLFRTDHPLYFELLEIINKLYGLGKGILKQRAKLGKIKFVMLSGAFARGKKQGADDIDLLVVGNVVLPQLSQIVRGEEVRRDREINYTVMTEEEFSFRKKRRDPFVLKVLAGSRIMIIGDEEELVN